MSGNQEYINKLINLKVGDKALLRSYSGLGMDKTLPGFDLFTSLFWPIRSSNKNPPPRKVAWLLAKLYGYQPLDNIADEQSLAKKLGRCLKNYDDKYNEKITKRYDDLITLPFTKIEPPLHWALNLLATNDLNLDWVKLAHDLSRWDEQETKLNWTNNFLLIT